MIWTSLSLQGHILSAGSLPRQWTTERALHPLSISENKNEGSQYVGFMQDSKVDSWAKRWNDEEVRSKRICTTVPSLFHSYYLSQLPYRQKDTSGSFSYPEEVRINEIDILFLLSAWSMSTKEIKDDASPLPSEADEGWTVVQRRDKRTHCFV